MPYLIADFHAEQAEDINNATKARFAADADARAKLEADIYAMHDLFDTEFQGFEITHGHHHGWDWGGPEWAQWEAVRVEKGVPSLAEIRAKRKAFYSR